MLLSIFAIYLACLLAGLAFNRQTDRILLSRAELDHHMGANLSAALGDVLTAVNIVNQAVVAKQMSAEGRAGFERKLDFLHVRSDHVDVWFGRLESPNAVEWDVLPSTFMRETGERALGHIEAFIIRGDRALANDFSSIESLATDLAVISEDLRRDVRFYEVEVTRFERALSASQSKKLVRLNNATWIFLAMIALAGSGSLLLLRREVVSRKLRAEAESRANYLAYHDAATGLPNRRSFVDTVTRALDKTRTGSIVIVDLDNFKDVNDRYGHAMGDAVLQHVGKSLERAVSEYEGHAARLGGDEFAVYLPQEDEVSIAGFSKSLRTLIESEVMCQGDVVIPEFSAGTATATQVAGSMELSFDALMRVSDFALYHAKATGRGRAVSYDADLATQFFERQELMRALPKAIADGQLEVFLQPKVELFHGKTFGFEALVRWRRNGKLLPPGAFIHVAEESGVIVDLDQYIIGEAVRVVSEWNRENETEFGVSVNISALQLVGEGLADFLRSVLWQNVFDARLLTLEITESIELDDWERVRKALHDLRSLGCRIAIDDFGTGYSSLAYLRAIAADELKIDKTLIDEVDTSDQACFIVDAVMDLAHSLRLTVVVEGVERKAQADVLRSLGCQFVQGYYYGRPVPAEEALANAMNSGDEGRRTVTLF